ncbi:hypothetical protein DUNSADRAFT_5110, partial [Dunaliella salina]
MGSNDQDGEWITPRSAQRSRRRGQRPPPQSQGEEAPPAQQEIQAEIQPGPQPAAPVNSSRKKKARGAKQSAQNHQRQLQQEEQLQGRTGQEIQQEQEIPQQQQQQQHWQQQEQDPQVEEQLKHRFQERKQQHEQQEVTRQREEREEQRCMPKISSRQNSVAQTTADELWPTESSEGKPPVRKEKRRRYAFVLGTTIGALGVLLLQASQHGLLAVQPRDVQLPGGLNITVPL